ncbi:unnamed protein product, partial [Musa textilis]
SLVCSSTSKPKIGSFHLGGGREKGSPLLPLLSSGGILGNDRRNPCQSGRIADQRRHLRKPVLLCSDGFSARYDAHIGLFLSLAIISNDFFSFFSFLLLYCFRTSI